MKIGLVGYGKMGKTVEKIALESGHEVTIGLDSIVDVAIDFTEPEAVKKTALALCKKKVPWVLGTTGWKKEEILEIVKKGEIPLIYGANFSIGMAFFSRLAKMGAILMKDSYDKVGIDIHHAEKKDSPSGTALQLMEEIPDISFQSIRVGHHPGTHQIIFDGPEDVIEMTHSAKSRNAFAKGAILGAEWLMGKQGIHTFDDLIKQRFACYFQEQLPLS